MAGLQSRPHLKIPKPKARPIFASTPKPSKSDELIRFAELLLGDELEPWQEGLLRDVMAAHE